MDIVKKPNLLEETNVQRNPWRHDKIFEQIEFDKVLF